MEPVCRSCREEVAPRLMPRFAALLDRLKARAGGAGAHVDAETILGPLVDAYCSEGRHYHDLSHIEHFLDELDAYETDVAGGLKDPDLVRLAAWFHDVWYDTAPSPETGRPPDDNEERSVSVAVYAMALIGLDEKASGRVRSLILYTKHRDLPPPTDTDAQAMVDADLASLGADQEAFDENTRKIRKEYAAYDASQFRAGRRVFYDGMLKRAGDGRHIYQTVWFRQRLEDRAIANLRHGLDILDIQGSLVD